MKSQILKSPLPYLALIIAHTIWGANFVVAKVTLHEFPVLTLAFLRFALAALLLTPFLLKLKPQQRKVEPKHIVKLFAAGLFFVTFNIFAFYEGLSRTLAIDASVLSLIVPIISILGGWLILREKIYMVNFIGIILGLSGAFTIIILSNYQGNAFATISILGSLLILFSNFSAVLGEIMAKQMMKIYSPFLMTYIVFLIGAITFFFPALYDYMQNPDWIKNVTILGVLGLLFITLLSSISAFFLLNYAISKVDIGKSSLFSYMEPAITASLAVPLLGERISYSFIIGTCLIILGVYWGTLGKPEHLRLHHKHHR